MYWVYDEKNFKKDDYNLQRRYFKDYNILCKETWKKYVYEDIDFEIHF